ncbi:MAG: hypothetical protein RL514_4281 [Verrucomicrobiota bacterium]
MNRAASKGDVRSEATTFDMANWRTAKLFVVWGIFLSASLSPALVSGAEKGNWPSFRGPGAAGVLEGLDLPARWDAGTGQGIRFKVAIPGLAHSSPVIWGDRLFVTTAVSSERDASFKPGLYGSGEASRDQSAHAWQILCVDKKSGKLLWEKTATQGNPKDKRHIKSSYANSTPATDGELWWRCSAPKGCSATRPRGSCSGRRISGAWMSERMTCRATNGAGPARPSSTMAKSLFSATNKRVPS